MIWTQKSLAKWEKENRGPGSQIKLPPTVVPASQIKKPKFDRNAYQREYMRKKRAAAKQTNE